MNEIPPSLNLNVDGVDLTSLRPVGALRGFRNEWLCERAVFRVQIWSSGQTSDEREGFANGARLLGATVELNKAGTQITASGTNGRWRVLISDGADRLGPCVYSIFEHQLDEGARIAERARVAVNQVREFSEYADLWRRAMLPILMTSFEHRGERTHGYVQLHVEETRWAEVRDWLKRSGFGFDAATGEWRNGARPSHTVLEGSGKIWANVLETRS